ncbi:hypothetical protein BASA50_003117 [Batrachochytrium salamandrivorans]|uniref:Uncharacterized protein n=1 Tax=Batrachochytrium salamandrivorans TaxID=1357716 RepID=A0ABQ8FKN9_9FUNG|nr:hypothetical protein BASA60_007511 [Batrachochytrium salamandrivorans]KAH6599310.1 hypothetical protein BASA50_003117 [Batrachochytrium salamandrivorans]
MEVSLYFHARNEVVVLDKHSDQRGVTLKCYFCEQYRNGLNLTDDTCAKDKLGVVLWHAQFSIRTNLYQKQKGLWTIGKTNLLHSYPITDDLGGISTARALTKEEKIIVRDLASSGTGAAPTLAYLRDKTGNQWTTRKEIYNEKVVARAEFL